VTLGANLFRAILQNRSGLIFSRHLYDDVWSLIKNPDRRIYLEIPEMLEEWKALANEKDPAAGYPFVLMAGERRSYNANQIYRSPAWRKIDAEGMMRMHPVDAQSLNIAEGVHVICESALGGLEAVVTIDESVRPGVVTLPHGYGMRYKESEPLGPALNRLTARQHCDPLTRTPFHKYVPVRIRKADATAA
jgi:anaerobic selenocysteine-containing dehydrogenase